VQFFVSFFDKAAKGNIMVVGERCRDLFSLGVLGGTSEKRSKAFSPA
jgi:predicted nucleotidyltransferase